MASVRDEATVRRLEADEARGFRALGRAIHGFRSPGASEVWDHGIATAVILGRDMPVNRAVGFGLEGPVPDGTLERLEALFGRHGLPCEVDVSPVTESAWVARLASAGYEPVRRFSLGAGQPAELLDGLRSRGRWPAELRIEDVTPATARTFVRTCVEGFASAPVPARPGSSVMFARGALAAPEIQCLLARLGGQPVATATITWFERHGHLGGMSTRPAYRRQGIQTALIARRLELAVARGCDLASVKVTPGTDSERNVWRAGFAEVCAKATWAKPREGAPAS